MTFRDVALDFWRLLPKWLLFSAWFWAVGTTTLMVALSDTRAPAGDETPSVVAFGIPAFFIGLALYITLSEVRAVRSRRQRP